MCRMLGIISRKPIPSKYLRDFRVLAEVGKVPKGAKEPGHKDGWGIVYYDGEAPMYLGVQPSNALQDEKYDVAMEKLEETKMPGVLIAHLRKRSVGTVSLENTLPFINGKWCFAHNGTIYNFHREGEDATDSKRFFRSLIQEMESSNNGLEDAIRRVVTDIRTNYKYSSLTFLLSDGNKLYAYRDFSRPKDEDYYGLMYAEDDQMVLFTQERMWQKDWTTVSNKCLVVVDKELGIKHFKFNNEC